MQGLAGCLAAALLALFATWLALTGRAAIGVAVGCAAAALLTLVYFALKVKALRAIVDPGAIANFVRAEYNKAIAVWCVLLVAAAFVATNLTP